jgi:hypothetical protein
MSDTAKTVKIDRTLVESIDHMVWAIAYFRDRDALRLLAECQQCRNRLLYLLDTRSDGIMLNRIAALKEDHRVHIPGSTDGPSTEPPSIRTVIS